MLNYYEAKGNNPYTNLAIERTLVDQSEGISLYLWVNQPSVIAGVNQDVNVEWNKKALKENNVLPVRRLTGGGCVYHDYGNLNFSFVCKEEDADFDRFIKVITNALKTFGIDAYKSGRNDILVDETKVSGTSWLNDDGQILFNGCILVDVDLNMLSRILTPSKNKLKGHGIESVKARVSNLVKFDPNITVEALKMAIVEAFEKEYGEKVINHSELPLDLDLESKLSDQDWIYQNEKEHTLSVETCIGNEKYLLKICENNAIITMLTVYTDSMNANIERQMQDVLVGRNIEELDDLLKQFEG